MTKSTTPKKIPTTESDMSEYDASIFEIRDRHYGSLLAVKKKIRACEKKIRELEQAATITDSSQRSPLATNPSASSKKSNTTTTTTNKGESQETKTERLNKIEHKKMQLSIWKEAALCIHSARKEELAGGVTNVSMADVVDGIDLLKQVLENEKKWDHYKCPNKKHLTKVDMERLRQLAHYLNVQSSSSNRNSRLSTFKSVVDFLSSPIAIGQECPMSFAEFVPMFDKLRKTLVLEIVVKEPTVVVVAAAAVEEQKPLTSSTVGKRDAHGSTKRIDGSSNIIVTSVGDDVVVDRSQNQQNRNNRSKRLPKGPKTGRKPLNGSNNANSSAATTNNNQNSSLPSIPEKLVVVVTSNARHRQHDDAPPQHTTSANSITTVSIEDIAKSTKQERVVELNKEIPSGRLIHHPNVPTDDSDEEGWILPSAGSKQKKAGGVHAQSQNGPRRGSGSNYRGGARNANTRGGGGGVGGGNTNGNANNRKTPTYTRKYNNNDDNTTTNFKSTRPQTMNSRPMNNADTTAIQSDCQF